MYEIKNHRLFYKKRLLEYRLTPNRTKNVTIKPEGILLHDTAGRLDGSTTVEWFLNPRARASAHLVVHRDGKVTQMAPFNRKTWHAGKSSLNGRPGVNNFSVGIEIVNPGILEPIGGGKYRAWFGEVYSAADHVILEKTTVEHGSGGWMDYSAEQLFTLESVCSVLFEKYELSWIWGHWKVSPGRKVDTNPLFPLRHLQAKVMGREIDEESLGTMLANTNQRRWPSYQDNVIQVIPKAKAVEIIRSGWYRNGSEDAQWHLVSYKNHEGWIHGSLIELA